MARENALVRDLLLRVSAAARRHAEALAHRRLELTGNAPPAVQARKAREARCSPSAAMQHAFELLAGATIRYAALLPVANRNRDSAITAPEGTTSHLVRDHLQEHLAAMGQVAGLIQHAVLAELTVDGYDCRCTCPACGIGLCVCGIGARAVLNEAWMAGRPQPQSDALLLSEPRKSSAAASAGVQNGDLLEEVDGVPLESFAQLQTTIKSHELGDTVKIGLLRGRKTVPVHITRSPDIGDGTLPLDCEAPSGQAFYLDRARDLQQRLRHRSGNGKTLLGITSLSARETQVLRLLADGATNPMIAEKLGISRPTVARHVVNILRKLNATNRAEAAAIAIANGLGAEP